MNEEFESTESRGPPPLYFFDDSVTGDCARSIDWTLTSLGPASQWPLSLKTILALLFKNRHAMFLFWGPENICFYNDAYLPSFGVGKHPRAMGQTAIECWPEIWDAIGPQIAQVKSTGVSTWHEDQLLPIFRNGSLEDVYWTYSYSAAHDDSGRIAGVIVTCTETTSSVLVRESIIKRDEQLKLAIRGGDMGTWSIQYPRGVLTSDERFQEIHCVAERIDVGNSIQDNVHPSDQAIIEKALREAGSPGAAYACEYRMRRGDGQYRWIYARGEPKFDSEGGLISISGVAYDIDERKKAQEDLVLAKVSAENANQAKSEFLANMSHEIRTPLGAIIGFSELLRESNVTLEDRERYVAAIVRNSQGLTRIIDDILDLAKVESGNLEIEEIEFALGDLLKETVDLFRDKAQQKQIYLLLILGENVPSFIRSDAVRVRQILVNIIGNAIKFTTRGGVKVVVSSTVPGTDLLRIVITVKDTGIGLSQDQRFKIFEPFVQADNTTTRRFGGTGLGLAISRRLANALGGDVSIDPAHEGEGCTFEVVFTGRVSLAKPEPESIGGPTEVPIQKSNGCLHGISILLAEDSADNQLLISRILTKQGAIVHVAVDGEEAVAQCLIASFSIILMDIQMPKMDGLEATRALRRAGVMTPIIALTAHAMDLERSNTKKAGCNAHLTKPINQVELIATIEELLSIRPLTTDSAKSI